MNIVAVDWGKQPNKRAAYRAYLAERRVFRLAFDGSLSSLVDQAVSLPPPVLLGVDAAIGFPEAAWEGLAAALGARPAHFVDFLLGPSLPADFFEPVATPDAWTPLRPFIRPPRGRWSLKAFVDASTDGIHRRIDRRLNGNPPFVTSGLPGSVGSGTRALWQELIALGSGSPVRVWPFNGPLESLLTSGSPVLAEIYPKACYGIALGATLPAPLRSIAKTREPARREALAELRASAWVSAHGVELHDLEAAESNEDAFDALVSAAALMRAALENAPLEHPDDATSKAEGGILASPCVVAGKAR